MLSRSNFSIRRLISHRRPRNTGEDEASFLLEQDERGTPKAAAQQHKVWSWMTPKQSPTKCPEPIIIVRSTEDIHRINHLPPLPDTPFSSKSSLCSCEYHIAGQAWPRQLGSSPALCPVPSKVDLGRRSTSPASILRDDGRLSHQLSQTTEEENITLPMTAESMVDHSEALSPLPGVESGLGPRAQKLKGIEAQEKEVGQCSDNVQRLIRETDEAFGSVGNAIAQAKLDPEPFRIIEKPSLDHPIRSPVFQQSSPRNPRRAAALTLKSPTRTGSISKPKREGPQKSRRRPRPAIREIPKWTNNAKELFNIRLFGRIEADEMLPLTRLEEIRLSRSSLLHPKRSTETLRTIETDGSETPIEPFHLQDLPSRIGAAGVSLSVPSPIEEDRTPRSSGIDSEGAGTDCPSEARDNEENKGTTSSAKTEMISNKDTIACRDISFPAPPARNPLRLARGQHPPLPAIPEVMVTSPENPLLSPSSDPATSKNEVFMFLPCNPYTLTVPTFRHGPIRLAKADLAITYSSSNLAVAALDETLDWTAFQMAILGGAGDFFGEATDYSRRSDGDVDEVDDLCDWFESFGFENHGLLIGERVTPSSSPGGAKRRSRNSRASAASAKRTDAGEGLPIPVEHEHPHGFWNQGQFDASRFYNARGFGIRRWAMEGHPKRYEKSLNLDAGGGQGRRASVHSLPQSPMMDLVVNKDSDGKGFIVPMGFNLGHDLGDFLKWEAEHVCAPGFYGPGETNNDI